MNGSTPSFGPARRLRFPAVHSHRFLCVLLVALATGYVRGADDHGPWMVVGPWEAKVDGSLSGVESGLRLVATKVRITLDLDQPAPFGGGGAIPVIDFPPMVKALRVEDGELILRQHGGATTLPWQGEFLQVRPGVWQGGVTASNTATGISAKMMFDAETRTWRVSSIAVRLDLASWGVLALHLAQPAEEGWTFGGTATLGGNVVWNPDGLDGSMTLAVHEGRIRNGDGKVSVEGAEGEFQLTSLARLTMAPGQRLTVRAVTAGTVNLANVAVGFGLRPGNRVTVQAEADGFGGKLAVEPFEFDPAAPALHVAVKMTEVQAQGVLALFPDAPQGDAVLSGRVPFSYEDGRLVFGEGKLAVKPGTSGRVRFHNPGLFTQALSSWIPGRKVLGEIETGREAFVVSELTIELHPGAVPGRAAQIRLVGVPADHPRDGPFTFDFNINAPLETFLNLNLGKKQNMHFEVK